MPSYLIIAELLVAVALVLVVLLQVKGGGLGGIFGQSEGGYRTRRGLEKSLFQLTIVLAILFIAISIWIVRVASTV